MSTVYDGQPGNVAVETPMTITGVSNTTPITITVSGSLPPEFYLSGGTGGGPAGPLVDITGVLGCTAANGQNVATPTGASTFTIPRSGNGAYTSGGTVAPLYLKSTYTVPSDGDLDNEASINSWAISTGDRTQFLASRIGHDKLYFDLVLQNISDGGATPPNTPTAWAKNSSIGNVFAGMVTPGNAGIVFTIPDMFIGDYAIVTLSTTLLVFVAGATTGQVAVSLAYGFGPLLATPFQTTGYTYFTKWAKFSGSSTSDYYPLEMTAKIVAPSYSDGSLSGNAYVTLWADTFGVNAIVNLCGDSRLTARHYRPTGMPQ